MAVKQLRLDRTALSSLPSECRPAIDPADLRTGMVHLGVGAFHRAHQAVFTEAAIAASGGDWGTVGVAPSSRSVVDALAAQDNLFSVVTLGGADGERARVVAALTGTAHAASDPAAVTALIADPAVRIISLTVTEKAYRPGAALLRLLLTGLAARAAADAGPITLLSCDNLPANGRALRAALIGELATTEQSSLAEWFEQQVSCPSSMVDRIVPASTVATLSSARRILGTADLAAVAAEPFRQWVIEDDFAAGRPDWAAAGATFTSDVTDWEHLKLRGLNGVHSALAYLGALAGRETIAEALDLPGMRSLLRSYVSGEVAASLAPPDGVSVVDYGDTVLERFANPQLGHRTWQVAMDGSQKLPQRVVSVVDADGVEPQLGTLILAAWAQFALGRSDDGGELPLDDPRAAEIRADPTTAALFGPGGILPLADPAHLVAVQRWRDELASHGAAEVVRRCL
ncbi:fructuronate reductase [Allocatelliglobosispora scoriae]|uniref:Fructuronate reductase n=1 Tax=Allocatelliglobosispora scoriae TaxID=643052 RepID=A0A841BTQ9_9ACTN|nr:mannitol dehydrogenase family protein [Allocatelliglobosispora scoriae]MBB5870303.1 fructuronate reductase [Allocatelliglobosispora scoriae]